MNTHKFHVLENLTGNASNTFFFHFFVEDSRRSKSSVTPSRKLLHYLIEYFSSTEKKTYLYFGYELMWCVPLVQSMLFTFRVIPVSQSKAHTLNFVNTKIRIGRLGDRLKGAAVKDSEKMKKYCIVSLEWLIWPIKPHNNNGSP